MAVRRDRKCLRLYLPAQTPDAEEERERTALDTVIAETCTRELRIEGLSAKVDPTQLKALARLGSGTFGYVELVICESGPHKGRTMAVKVSWCGSISIHLIRFRRYCVTVGTDGPYART